jgi:hypothetical protein
MADTRLADREGWRMILSLRSGLVGLTLSLSGPQWAEAKDVRALADLVTPAYTAMNYAVVCASRDPQFLLESRGPRGSAIKYAEHVKDVGFHALAGLGLNELGDDVDLLGFGEAGNRGALGLDSETRAMLLPGRDTIVGNSAFHTKGIPPFALWMNAQSEQ